jgi:hypothetical protein
MSENPVEERLMRLAELFGGVCADPDNPEVAARADQALWELDEFLATAT